MNTATRSNCVILAIFGLIFVLTWHRTEAQPSLIPAITPTINVTGSSIASAQVHSITASTSQHIIHSASVANVTINVTSAAIVVPSATVKPTPTPSTSSNKEEGRRFDGLSFFGGMILGAVICVILFFAIKYYRAKQRSYHSL